MYGPNDEVAMNDLAPNTDMYTLQLIFDVPV